MSFIEYINNVEKTMILITDKITYLLNIMINNHIFKIIVFLAIFTIIVIIISKLITLSYTDTELDKERELARLNIRIGDFKRIYRNGEKK